MLKVLSQNDELVMVDYDGELFLVTFGDDPTSDVAVKITADQAQNIMARGGWTDIIEAITTQRITILFDTEPNK